MSIGVPEIAVLDTHALIWWASGQHCRLGRRARAFFDAVDAERAIACVPTLALVELSEAARNGNGELDEPFADFVANMERRPSRFQVVPLTSAIVVRAHNLFAIPERGDRLIAATAIELGYPLVTRDPAIERAAGVELVW